MAKEALATGKPYEQKAVLRNKAMAYHSFGWVISKDVPSDEDLGKMKGKKKCPDTVIKRKYGFTYDTELTSYENTYFKWDKKKYRQKPILGIISFILMLAFFAIAVVGLFYGIEAFVKASGNDEETAANAAEAEVADAANATDEEKEGGVLDKIHKFLDPILIDEKEEDDPMAFIDKVLAPEFLVGKEEVKDEKGEVTEEAKQGLIDNVIGEEPEGFMETLASLDKVYVVLLIYGVVALILFIIFLILFIEVAKIKKKRARKFREMAIAKEHGEIRVAELKRQDPTLMGKPQRKRAMWQGVITLAVKDAIKDTFNGNSFSEGAPAEDDYDNDEF